MIYRYDFGIVGCYYNDTWDEYSSEAEQIANHADSRRVPIAQMRFSR